MSFRWLGYLRSTKHFHSVQVNHYILHFDFLIVCFNLALNFELSKYRIHFLVELIEAVWPKVRKAAFASLCMNSNRQKINCLTHRKTKVYYLNLKLKSVMLWVFSNLITALLTDWLITLYRCAHANLFGAAKSLTQTLLMVLLSVC